MRDPRALERAIRRIAECRIREAIEAGEFDDLPGSGLPIPDIDQPYDPLWWVRKWMRREALRQALAEDGGRPRAVAAMEELRQTRSAGSGPAPR